MCACAMSPVKYVQEAVRNCTVHLAANYGGKSRLPKKAVNPFKMGYNPEMDTSPQLDQDAASYYLTIIGILKWMIELGRIDIIAKVSLLSSHAVLPRERHLDASVHVLAHVVNHSVFKKCHQSEFYSDAKEAIPINAPEPWGKEVAICMFVDSDHAGDKDSHRSRSGFLIQLNTTMVQWFLKKQYTVT